MTNTKLKTLIDREVPYTDFKDVVLSFIDENWDELVEAMKPSRNNITNAQAHKILAQLVDWYDLQDVDHPPTSTVCAAIKVAQAALESARTAKEA